MGKRIRNFVLLFTTILLLVVVVAGAALWWRVSQGPVSFAFLKDTVQERINASLPDVSVQISDVVVERDKKTGQPRFRLKDVKFSNAKGRLIARAPSAAIDVRISSLLAGRIEPHALELIGAKLLVQRTAQGEIGFGFGALNSVPITDPIKGSRKGVGKGQEKKSNKLELDGVEFITTKAANLLDLLSGKNNGSPESFQSLSKLDSLRITQTSITLYDQTNGAIWHSPKANLVFRRAPYGFALFVDAEIAARKHPWRIEMTAHYRNKVGKFKVSSRVFGLVPAEISKDVFALSQLAQVQLPLAGHVEAEFTKSGKLTQASAELSASAGRVGFPGYISEPIIIDEGLVRLDFEPKTGDILIGNSSIFVGGSQAELTGRISPIRNTQGKLTNIAIKLNSKNVAINATGGVKNPVVFDTVKFDGVASLETPRLTVNDLILMAGNSGIRVRGYFIGDGHAAGVFLGGTIRDLPAATIKKLWPPVVAKGAREWITENVKSGRMTTGAFKVAIPAKTIEAASNDVPIPDEMVDFKFELKDVRTKYYKDLPVLTGASGTGVLTGNHFTLNVKGGQAQLSKNHTIKLLTATMNSVDLTKPVTPSTLKIKIAGPAASLLKLVNHKSLKLAQGSGLSDAKVSGKGVVTVNLDLPLSRKMVESQVKTTASANWSNAGIKGVLNGADVTKGDINIVVSSTSITAKGKASLNGLPARIQWSRPIGTSKNPRTKLVVSTTVTENKRKELGVDLSRFVRGRVGLKMTSVLRGNDIVSTLVQADLSKAILVLDELNWVHPAGKKTTATFNFSIKNGIRKITNLKVSGGGMKVAGNLTIDKNGKFIKASFPKFLLDRTKNMSLVATRSKGHLLIAVKGKIFDARPFINQAFSVRSTPKKAKSGDQLPTTIKLNFKTIVANRGEQIKNMHGELRTHNGKILRANLRGQFVGGAPLSLQIGPNNKGGRNLQFISRDAGAAVRAANLYSKIVGGTLALQANLAVGKKSGIEKGLLILRHFTVLDDTTLKKISSQRRTARNSGPRKKRLRADSKFRKLKIPFSTDERFVRIGDALIQGAEIGGTANGRIRKSDGAMEIGGAIIPAYQLNSAISGVPVLGQILTGGKGQGIFGLTYVLRGTIAKPKFLVNPVSALAPGFLRQLFTLGGGNVGADGTGTKRKKKKEHLQN